MIIIEPTPENKAKINAHLPSLAAHALPLWLAVRDLDCVYLCCEPDLEPFKVPFDRSTIAVFGDDYGYGTAKGPDGFHRPSLAAYLGQCCSIALVTCEAVPLFYVITAGVAVRSNGCTAIIESLPEKEADWLAFIAQVAPGVPFALATTEGEGGVH